MEYHYPGLSAVLHGSVSPSTCSLTLYGGTSIGLSVGSVKGSMLWVRTGGTRSLDSLGLAPSKISFIRARQT